MKIYTWCTKCESKWDEPGYNGNEKGHLPGEPCPDCETPMIAVQLIEVVKCDYCENYRPEDEMEINDFNEKRWCGICDDPGD